MCIWYVYPVYVYTVYIHIGQVPAVAPIPVHRYVPVGCVPDVYRWDVYTVCKYVYGICI